MQRDEGSQLRRGLSVEKSVHVSFGLRGEGVSVEEARARARMLRSPTVSGVGSQMCECRGDEDEGGGKGEIEVKGVGQGQARIVHGDRSGSCHASDRCRRPRRVFWYVRA